MPPIADLPTRADALRRIAAEVSGRHDLDGLFRDVIDEAFTLFGVDQAGLWTYDDGPTAAQAGRPAWPVARDPRDHRDAAPRCPDGRDGRAPRPTGPRPRRRARDDRAEVRGDLPSGRRPDDLLRPDRVPRRGARPARPLPPVGLRLDARRDRARPRLRRPHGDRHRQCPAGRLDPDHDRPAPGDLRAGRPAQPAPGRRRDRQRDRGRGRSLVDHDTIRVYRVDHETGMCEPIAFQGTFMGVQRPGPVAPSRPDRDGSDRLGRRPRRDRPARRRRGRSADARRPLDRRPGVDAARPDDVRGTVHGVIVVSKDGRDRFDDDDETTLAIFAGYAAQALVNGANIERLRQQRGELEHQLEGQRRLLEVNERLLSTLEPAGVLDLIANSLRAIVPYDSLTIYQVDRAAGSPPRGHRPRPVRRADPRPRDPARERAHRLGHRPRRGHPRQPRRTSTRARSRSPARRSSPRR